MILEPERRTYTIAETAIILGISERHAYELARASQIPARRLGARWVVPVQALEAFLLGPDASGAAGPR
ncbi:hypothetical protein acdb102_16110 [Acidothermaceae bacterium B102]|nr:hypothetical protein acdb102_16110 [Acidothermaceae bacterium B102]